MESIRLVSPAGVIETRRLPGSGAGPSPDRLLIGSEGVLGIITEASMRLTQRPVHKATCSIAYDEFEHAVQGLRALAQSGLNPANCRLLDPAEAQVNRVASGGESILVLGFESAVVDVNGPMSQAVAIACAAGGRVLDAKSADQDDAAQVWRNSFLRMPYYRDLMTGLGIIADTFETAVTWDGFLSMYEGVRRRVGEALHRTSEGNRFVLSCRITHVYPDGLAPYFTFYSVGSTAGDIGVCLEKWREIKRAANSAVIDFGGTATHHHAVGRDHRPAYERQSPPLFRESLRAVKSKLDPSGILNPGVLIDPAGVVVGARGVLRETR